MQKLCVELTFVLVGSEYNRSIYFTIFSDGEMHSWDLYSIFDATLGQLYVAVGSFTMPEGCDSHLEHGDICFPKNVFPKHRHF
jgi:hypothetical protein